MPLLTVLLRVVKFAIVAFFENRKGPRVSAAETHPKTQLAREREITKLPEILAVPYSPKFVPQNIVTELPWHASRRWRKRDVESIDRIILHQSMSMGSIRGINNYHITPGKNNHISLSGCPHICYTYAIGRGRLAPVYQTNWHEDIVWHARGQNYRALGILVCGDFGGPGYVGREHLLGEQASSLRRLIDFLIESSELPSLRDYSSVYGHNDFGKSACPGYDVQNEIVKIKGD